ncbi:amidase [Annulohypoxylon truncatum]|uniref:amidase n=1 Tax=Annulohypoxylon truncatum TaxID=327061 RepID=UPI0020088E91|nr:amidase [Annulohypoxylon truncatum]KAI1204111.1 amidase [Annulohypoxylon truncatum]
MDSYLTADSFSLIFISSIAIVILSLKSTTLLKTKGPMRVFVSQGQWQETAAKKRKETLEKIKPEWILEDSVLNNVKHRRVIVGEFIEGLLDDETRRFTMMDVPELSKGISDGSFRSTQVVTAFCKRAAFAHQLNQNLLEIGFDQAISHAQKLDEYYDNHQKVIGPLHGIPITLKDQFHVKGMETTMGYVGWIGTFEGEKGTGKEKMFESELVRELVRLGAVPIGKTSLVTSLWAPETNNHISGYVWNPHNTLLSAGGSSGGEGALQALRGSPIGFGTDIGGSVSMPASYNGLFSLKPSAGRLPFKGVANSGSGQQVMPTVIGIIGHSITAVRIIFESLMSVQPSLHDPYALPIPYRRALEQEIHDTSRLNLGFMEHDGVVRPHPPIARALRMVKSALERGGHKLIPWKQPSPDEAVDIHTAIARGDGCIDVWENLELSGEPPVPEIEHLFPRKKPSPSMSLRDHEMFCIRMKRYRELYMNYWNSTVAETDNGHPVEAVILAVTPYAAILPGSSYYFGYNCFINVLDYTSIVIPVTFANEDLDVVDSSFQPLTGRDEVNMGLYDAKKFHGAPAGIQIMGRRLHEERLLRIAQLVGQAVEKYKESGGNGMERQTSCGICPTKL